MNVIGHAAAPQQNVGSALLSTAMVEELTGLSELIIRRRVRVGAFPRPARSATGGPDTWRPSDVSRWCRTTGQPADVRANEPTRLELAIAGIDEGDDDDLDDVLQKSVARIDD
jgi:predicted DNA-binding transcriptional regulator AlpA